MPAHARARAAAGGGGWPGSGSGLGLGLGLGLGSGSGSLPGLVLFESGMGSEHTRYPNQTRSAPDPNRPPATAV